MDTCLVCIVALRFDIRSKWDLYISTSECYQTHGSVSAAKEPDDTRKSVIYGNEDQADFSLL